ncbi:MAG: chlorite dismutase, partial [Roseiflexaceae bacterium]|nr:chlorite dismutase [Roseiflexaceae bacterium]
MTTEEIITRPAYFVTYCGFKIDPTWRRLPQSARADGRATFAQAVAEFDQIKTYSYSTIGFKTSCELLLWRKGLDAKLMQEM